MSNGKAGRVKKEDGAVPRALKGSRRRLPPKGARDFYASVLEEAERAAFEAAHEIEGLDEEIALLRVKLQTALAELPEDHELLLKGIGLMVRAVSARYRISGKAEEDLYQSVVGVLEGLGDVLLPEGQSNGG